MAVASPSFAQISGSGANGVAGTVDPLTFCNNMSDGALAAADFAILHLGATRLSSMTSGWP